MAKFHFLWLNNIPMYNMCVCVCVRTNKGPSSQGYGFFSGHVWMSELKTIKKAECRRIDAFEL